MALLNGRQQERLIPRHYDGMMVHRSRSNDGIIEIVDRGDIRSMHFGTFPKQSSMSLTAPHTLILRYTEVMMACLLLNPNPSSVLIIGLGGGSVVRFLRHYFPECHIDVVEYRQDVVDVAYTYFQVPEDDPQIMIHVEDGCAFVQRCQHQAIRHYDLLIVDAYDHSGMAPSTGTPVFFDSCECILTARGIMSVNLWQGIASRTMTFINNSFNYPAMKLPVRGRGNIISLATMKPLTRATLKQLKNNVVSQEKRFNINLVKSWRYLIRQQSSFISRWLT